MLNWLAEIQSNAKITISNLLNASRLTSAAIMQKIGKMIKIVMFNVRKLNSKMYYGTSSYSS